MTPLSAASSLGGPCRLQTLRAKSRHTRGCNRHPACRGDRQDLQRPDGVGRNRPHGDAGRGGGDRRPLAGETAAGAATPRRDGVPVLQPVAPPHRRRERDGRIADREAYAEARGARAGDGDVALAVGLRRRLPMFCAALETARERGARIVLIADPTARRSAELADWVVRCEGRSPSPFDSDTCTMSMVQFLCSAAANRLRTPP